MTLNDSDLPTIQPPEDDLIHQDDGDDDWEATLALPTVHTEVDPDPYFGLLTRPLGRWSVIIYGPEANCRAVVVSGCAEFRRKSLNFFSSFAGGRIVADLPNIKVRSKTIYETVMVVPTTMRRLQIALELYMYVHLPIEMAEHAKEKEATKRANDFYHTQIEHSMEGVGISARDVLSMIHGSGQAD